jgi:copper homeostasis protein
MTAVVSAPLLEVIFLDALDARHAQEGDADRVELVSDIASRGLTPALETFAAVREATSLPQFRCSRRPYTPQPPD